MAAFGLCRVEAGIIDPAKAVRVALENAVSVASVLLLSEATMTEIKEPPKALADRELASLGEDKPAIPLNFFDAAAIRSEGAGLAGSRLHYIDRAATVPEAASTRFGRTFQLAYGFSIIGSADAGRRDWP